MRKRSAEEKQKQLERFLMNVAEAADAALWEYWREKEAEHRRFATEYVTRRGLIPQQCTSQQILDTNHKKIYNKKLSVSQISVRNATCDIELASDSLTNKLDAVH